MPRFGIRIAAIAALLIAPAREVAARECRVVDVDLKPSKALQIVAWLEDAQGNYVETLFLTDGVGRRGLGNRPGRFDLNSGAGWPYGRRTTTFPIWARRHGLDFPLLVFQNSDDGNVSHPSGHSSSEGFYCRPIAPYEAIWDAGTCASRAFTDKGRIDPSARSLYPPRADLVRGPGDGHDVELFEAMNPFDEISSATPIADAPFEIRWPLPEDLPAGDYVVWLEVAKERDHNATYSAEAYPSPIGIPWVDYGVAYRGQPSVVYRVPIAIGTTAKTAMTATYAGYGDPDGLDGNVRVPDGTIDTDVPGSGAARLLLDVDGRDRFRVRVTARPEFDLAMPDPASELSAVVVDHDHATVRFAAPGEDGPVGVVSGYEVRLRAGGPITEDNFVASTPVAEAMVPDEPGQLQTVELTGLLPETVYQVAVRAYDDCRNYGPIAVTTFTTPDRPVGEVDACFVATAAYGSPLATEVTALRGFRDAVLRRSVLGELFVETYYTVGPAFAETIDHSDALRHAARDGLAPLVDLVRGLKP